MIDPSGTADGSQSGKSRADPRSFSSPNFVHTKVKNTAGGIANVARKMQINLLESKLLSGESVKKFTEGQKQHDGIENEHP